jgi:hypothetical protein
MRDSQRLFDHLELLEVTLQELRRNVNPRMAALNFLSEISQAGAN